MTVRPDLREVAAASQDLETVPPADGAALVDRHGRPHRWLHPVAWWAWGVGVSVAAARTTNPLLLLLLGVAVVHVAVVRRRPGPAGRSVRMFVQLGLLVIAVRMVLTVVFSAPGTGRTVLSLPQPPLPAWLSGLGLGGPVTADQLLGALYGGCRLAVVLVCFGAVNTVSSGYRLVRSLPSALHEAGVAVGVAVTLAPELVAEVARVRSARRLRGRAGGLRGVRGTVLPVLESALERSVDMAASMDVRGYGRRAGTTRSQRLVDGLLLGAVTVLLVSGLYGRLSPGAPGPMGLPALVGGGMLLGVVLWRGSRRSTRTVYGRDPWALPEWAVAGSGVLCALLVGLSSDLVLHPLVAPFSWPTLTLGTVLAVCCALLPGVVAPLPPGSPA